MPIRQLALCLFLSIAIQGPVSAQMLKSSKIYVAGHRGLVGSAIMRTLQARGYDNIVSRTSGELDLRDQRAVDAFFAVEKPEYVFLAAARVGGIVANNEYPADFIYDNLMISSNVVFAAHAHAVKKLLFLGSSCIYPRNAPQPIKEEYLLSSELEKTNEAYAIAKIAGLKLCEFFNRQHGTNFISVMPTNLYGPGDNFDLKTSHVLPALMRKFVEAKQNGSDVVIWGSGTPYREFLFVDDLADAVIFLMNTYDGKDVINIGYGEDLSIKDLAYTLKEAVGFEGEITYDSSKPDGTPRKLLDITRIKKLGWMPKTTLQQGIKQTLDWAERNNIFKKEP